MLGEFRSMTAPQTEDIAMAIAKLFKIGRDQAVRLPKGYRFEGEEVYIKRVGAAVVLLKRPDFGQWRGAERRSTASGLQVKLRHQKPSQKVPLNGTL
jgi:virulence-associated protein VagC